MCVKLLTTNSLAWICALERAGEIENRKKRVAEAKVWVWADTVQHSNGILIKNKKFDRVKWIFG